MTPPSWPTAVLLFVPFVTGDLAAQGARKRVISRFDITWTFDKAYSVGQFANDDWWVVGPVKVVKIDPRSTSGSRIMNGSMINPSPKSGGIQSYDNKTAKTSYSGGLNVALDVSASKPLVVKPYSSLVSTISHPTAGARPQVKGCSVLTVLPAAAKPGDFRPSYCGSDKTIRFNASQLKVSLLKKLKPVGTVPSLASVEKLFERPWMEHIPGWTGKYIHASDNMANYGREISMNVGKGALMLHLDISIEAKMVLLVRMVQLGIDNQGIADDGGHNNWQSSGGHMSGRKWPILFAGLMLDDPHMKAIGTQNVAFGEDQQTYYITQADITRTGHPQSDLGKPMWGADHAWRPARDKLWGQDPYQLCCTSNAWQGEVLACRIMGVKSLWNHDALFDYLDRYRTKSSNLPAWMQSMDPWALQMWDQYRSQY